MNLNMEAGCPARPLSSPSPCCWPWIGRGSRRDALTIYLGRTQNLIGPLLERFNKETGIPIDGTGTRPSWPCCWPRRATAPGRRVPVPEPGATGFLAGKGRLGQLEATTLDKVDARFRNADGRWVGISPPAVLVYNSEQVTEAERLDSVLDLTGDRFTGKVAVAPSNGSFQDFVTAMRQLEGEEATAAWLKAMVANKPRTYANNNAIVEAVGRGEVEMGLVNHYYNYRFQQESPGHPEPQPQLRRRRRRGAGDPVHGQHPRRRRQDRGGRPLHRLPAVGRGPALLQRPDLEYP